MRRCLVYVTLFALLSAAASPLWADTQLPMPEGRVILTVSGKLTHTNVGDEARFDVAMLEALGMHDVVTHTPWTDGASRYSGPLGRALLKAVGANGDKLSITALNDYVAEIPVSDFIDNDVILALKRDGKPLSVRDFGPVFVLYPFDEHPELQTEKIRFRSVWQVTSIEIE